MLDLEDFVQTRQTEAGKALDALVGGAFIGSERLLEAQSRKVDPAPRDFELPHGMNKVKMSHDLLGLQPLEELGRGNNAYAIS